MFARDKNRSVQYPNDGALKYLLDDSHKNSVSVIAIAAGSVSIVIFLLIFGVLQFRSKRKLRYSKIVQTSYTSKSEDEDEDCKVSLIDGEDDRA